MSGTLIMRALKHGPMTTAQLADEVCDSPGGIARTCAALRRKGRIVRVDGQALGRGRKATYALTPKEN